MFTDGNTSSFRVHFPASYVSVPGGICYLILEWETLIDFGTGVRKHKRLMVVDPLKN